MKYRQSLKHRARMTMIDIRHRVSMRMIGIRHRVRMTHTKHRMSIARTKRRIHRRLIHIKYGFFRYFSIMSSTRGRVAFRAFGIACFVYYDGMHRWRKPRVSKVSSGKHVTLGRISMIF